MDMHELELGDTPHQHRVDLPRRSHATNPSVSWGDIVRGRRREEHLTGHAVDNGVPELPVAPRLPLPASGALHQSVVDLPDQGFGDRLAASEEVRQQIEGLPVVQEFPGIVRGGLRGSRALPDAL